MPDKKLKIFIIAGEVSGDVLGAKVMTALPGVDFAGVGGENMQAAGLESLFPISDLAVMGFIEVLGKARTLTRRIRETADAIIKFQPDIVLTIDSPSFAKAVINRLKSEERRAKLKDNNLYRESSLSSFRSPLFYHIVAPQVWAWGAKRARKYAKIFDRLYCFFDFEKPYFEKYGLPTVAVGHPIADGLVPALHKAKGKGQKAITLIPGSRMSEVKKLLPIFKQVAEQITLSFVLCPSSFFIPTVETTREYIERETAGWAVRPTLIPAKDRYELFAKTDVAIAASGTVSAELAIMHIPAIVVYKMNWLTEKLARIFVKTKWASLVNILLQKTVYPELLGRDATADNIIEWVKKLSDGNGVRARMISELSNADKLWHKSKPAAALIADDIMSVNN